MAINKITERELSQNLLDKIKNAGGKVKLIKKSTDITNATNTVAIGIPGFDKATDSMLIFKNTTLLNDDEFTISEDSKNIVKSEGNWNEINETMTFTFIVFKYVPELAPGEGLGLTEEQVIEIVKQYGTNEAAVIDLIKKYALSIENGADLDFLMRAFNSLNSKVLEIMIYLDLESSSDVNETGIWFDVLANGNSILKFEGDMRLDTTQKKITGTNGAVTFKPVDVEFECDRVRYMHDVHGVYQEMSAENPSEISTNTLKINTDKFEIV